MLATQSDMTPGPAASRPKLFGLFFGLGHASGVKDACLRRTSPVTKVVEVAWIAHFDRAWACSSGEHELPGALVNQLGRVTIVGTPAQAKATALPLQRRGRHHGIRKRARRGELRPRVAPLRQVALAIPRAAPSIPTAGTLGEARPRAALGRGTR